MSFALLGERKIARMAVIGGGTAGHMAALTLSHYFKDIELFHIYDPAIPIIGVGEGTLVTFPGWIHTVTGLSEQELGERCGVTRKYGITFESWGHANRIFYHDFFPVDQAYSYHLSAPRIVRVL